MSIPHVIYIFLFLMQNQLTVSGTDYIDFVSQGQYSSDLSSVYSVTKTLLR